MTLKKARPFKIFYFFILSLIFYTCTNNPQENARRGEPGNNLETDSPETLKTASPPDTLEQSLIASGLVNIQRVDSTLLVKLKYSTEDNFFGFDVYGALTNAYLQPVVAKKLARAQQLLKEKNPDYSLLIYDGVRPRRVQQILWDAVEVPLEERAKYVADPRKGSLHNYGVAVDLTIVDKDRHPLDMGTAYDYFGPLAHPAKEEDMLLTGKLTEAQVANRKLLREVMQTAGFSPIRTEWWHFNAYSLQAAKEKFAIVE